MNRTWHLTRQYQNVHYEPQEQRHQKPVLSHHNTHQIPAYQ